MREGLVRMPGVCVSEFDDEPVRIRHPLSLEDCP